MRVGFLVAWPLVLAAAKLVAHVRWRFVVVFAAGWLTALVVATTAEPRPRAATIGLTLGAGGAVLIWLAVRTGIRLTWLPGEVILRDDSPTPKAEYIVAGAIAIAALVGVLA